MENASKALIIAGAILLSILLISLGILIFNQAQSAINSSGMSDAELTAFNQKFTKYEGNQKGSTIRALAQEVMANNNNQEASDETAVAITGGIVGLSGNVGSNDLTFNNSFKNTATYNVKVKYSNKGRINEIIVSNPQ